MDENKSIVKREEFGVTQTSAQLETAATAIAAREQATVQAEYIMAERHKRVWEDVRARMLDHCRRPKFSDISRYSRPVGKEFINGEWVEKKATGFTIRFAEILAQEMANVKPWSALCYDDQRLRIVRIGVTDLERNLPRSREIGFSKTVERRGKRKGNDWQPPEGRDVVGQRVNSKGDPIFIVLATEAELRATINAEESRTHRDFITRLCPRDILEDCEELINNTLQMEDKKDPLTAVKRLLDRFHEFGVMPSDLDNYMGKPSRQWMQEDITELRELGAAIRDGQTSFQEALKIRYTVPEDGEPETKESRDARNRRQIAEQEQKAKAAEKIAEMTEQAKAQRTCKLCGKPGHDSRNCPSKSAAPSSAPGMIPVREVATEEIWLGELTGFAPTIKYDDKFYRPNTDRSAWVQISEAEAVALVNSPA